MPRWSIHGISLHRLTGSLMVPAALAMCACATADAGGAQSSGPRSDKPSGNQSTVQVEVLSRGRGVPAETLQVYQDIKALAQQNSGPGGHARINERVIGLEGERRLCISFADPKAAESLIGEIKEMAEGTELMRVSSSACDAAPKE